MRLDSTLLEIIFLRPLFLLSFSPCHNDRFSLSSRRYTYTLVHFETSLWNLDCVVRQTRKLAGAVRRVADSDFDWDAPNDLHIVFLRRRRAPLSLRRRSSSLLALLPSPSFPAARKREGGKLRNLFSRKVRDKDK